MKVYQVSREFYPYANAGGLKEVVTGIALSLINYNIDSSVFIPRYGFINKNSLNFFTTFNLNLGNENSKIDIFTTIYKGVKVYLIDYDSVSNKNDVYTYTKDDEKLNPDFKKGSGYIDSHKINSIFQLSFLEVVKLIGAPDVLSLHDGHTGLIPAIIKSDSMLSNLFNNTDIYFTIHNAGYAYHQRTPLEYIEKLNIINPDIYSKALFKREVDPLCLAVLYAKALTVSNYYANEIVDLVHEQSSDNFGKFCIDNNIEITGITNGVDNEHFKNFGQLGITTTKRKVKLKSAITALLENRQDVNVWGNYNIDPTQPLFLFQNRITEQKGIEEYIEAFKINLGRNRSQFIIMGFGEKKYEEKIINLCKNYPKDICYVQGYNEILAKKLFLASDFFILTSLWEPCGLTDFEAQLAGSIPIVNNTGGLKKVVHGKNGFIYSGLEFLVSTINTCCNLYTNNKKQLDEMQVFSVNYIKENYTWDKVVEKKYIPLFRGDCIE